MERMTFFGHEGLDGNVRYDEAEERAARRARRVA